jgi:hypothetical protein
VAIFRVARNLLVLSIVRPTTTIKIQKKREKNRNINNKHLQTREVVIILNQCKVNRKRRKENEKNESDCFEIVCLFIYRTE